VPEFSTDSSDRLEKIEASYTLVDELEVSVIK
jgi:hypothetical protein